MDQIEKTLNDYSLLHSFEVTHKVGKWNQTRLVMATDERGSPNVAMRTLTLIEKIGTLFGWRPASEAQIKLLLPKDASKELSSKVNNIFKNVGEYKVRELLQGKADEILVTACSCGNATTVKKLLTMSVRINSLDKSLEGGRTLLMLAAMNGHQDVVKALLDAGADPKLIDADEKTALDLAVHNGHSKIAQLLFKNFI